MLDTAKQWLLKEKENETLTILPQAFRRGSTPKKLHPIFAKFSGVGANFCFHYARTSTARQGKKFGYCTLAYFLEVELRIFTRGFLYN